jgi:Zn-dependent protease
MNVLVGLFTGITVVLVAIGIHEFAHAWTANALGDPTARYRGRVTLDPLAHLDPIGTLMILFTAIAGIGIGWGKPVPINPNNFRKNPPLSMAAASGLGPLSNFGQALIAAGLLQAVRLVFPPIPTTAVTVSRIIVVAAGAAALAAGGLLLYYGYQRRGGLGPSRYGDFSWRVEGARTGTPWWENEAVLQQVVRGGLGGVLIFGFLANPTGLLVTAVLINLGLAFFNLIPLGPLDGNGILRGLLRASRARWTYEVAAFLDRIEPFSGYILLGLIFLDQGLGIPIFTILVYIPARFVAGVLGV